MSNFNLHYFFSSLVSLFKLSRTLSFHGFRFFFFLKKEVYGQTVIQKNVFRRLFYWLYTNKIVGFSFSVWLSSAIFRLFDLHFFGTKRNPNKNSWILIRVSSKEKTVKNVACKALRDPNPSDVTNALFPYKLLQLRVSTLPWLSVILARHHLDYFFHWSRLWLFFPNLSL